MGMKTNAMRFGKAEGRLHTYAVLVAKDNHDAVRSLKVPHCHSCPPDATCTPQDDESNGSSGFEGFPENQAGCVLLNASRG